MDIFVVNLNCFHLQKQIISYHEGKMKTSLMLNL